MKPVSCLLLLVLSVSSVLGCDQSQISACLNSYVSSAQNIKDQDDFCSATQSYINCLKRVCSNAISQELVDYINKYVKTAGFHCELRGINAARRLGSSSLVLMVTAFFLSIGFLRG